MTFTPADLETLEAAAAELDGLALCIRQSNAVESAGVLHWEDAFDKDDHDKIKALSAKLYELRERAKA